MFGIRDHWGESAPNDAILERYGLSADQVARTVARLIGRPPLG